MDDLDYKYKSGFIRAELLEIPISEIRVFSINRKRRKVVPRWESFSSPERNFSGRASPGAHCRLVGASRITKSFSPASLSLSGFYLPSESRRNNTERILLCISLLPIRGHAVEYVRPEEELH